jgi:molecular chaperone GrpE
MTDNDHKEICDCLALRNECAEYKAGWQRAQADYQNLKKETEARRGEWAAMSEAEVVEEFLPVYDNFKKAFAAAHTEDGWAKGIGFIMKQFGDVLKAHGIEEMKTVGEVFDAARHEAVGEEPAQGGQASAQGGQASDSPPHTIIREVDGGYLMGGKVVKVAKVIIAS